MSELLRRRGKLDPINETLARDLEEDEDSSDDPFVIVYSSPCQIRVSNDPGAEPKPITKPNPCNITFYDCSESGNKESLNVFQEQSMSIEYDYELHYTKGADLDQTLYGLEASMLEHLASATGLVDCPVLQTRRRLEETRGRRLSKNHDLPDLFSAVSSDRVDTADNFRECVESVPESLSSSLSCQPMKGSMTAFIRGDVELGDSVKSSVEDSIHRFVRAGMNSNIYTTGNVLKVSYIGTTSDEGVAAAKISQQSESGRNGLGLEVIIIMLALTAAITTLVAAILLLRRTRAPNDANEGDELQLSQQSSRDLDLTAGPMAERDSLSLKPQDMSNVLSLENGSDGTTSDSDSDEGKNSPPRTPPRNSKLNRSPTEASEKARVVTTNAIIGATGNRQNKRRKKMKPQKLEGSQLLESIPE